MWFAELNHGAMKQSSNFTATIPHLPGRWPAHHVHKYMFEPAGVKIKGKIKGTSKQYSFGLMHLKIRSMLRRAPRQGKLTYTPASVHLRNTTAKRRGIAKALLGQFKENAELNLVDIIGSDFNTSAYRERGKAKVSSIEEASEETQLIPPPDLVPMWSQMADSGDCGGFILTKKNVKLAYS